MTKEQILTEIRRTAEENGGVPLGRARFQSETGIKISAWYGRFWATWGEAVREAGYGGNAWNAPHSEEHLLESYARLAREHGRLPRMADLRIQRLNDPTFPAHNTFERFGGKADLLVRVRAFCESRPEFADVLPLLGPSANGQSTTRARRRVESSGYVYLTRFGRHFKIGRTNAAGRRERELAIQLPERSKTVHVIETDDPEGIEAYWHRRFAPKRGNGEWFALDAADVAAFKRRRFM